MAYHLCAYQNRIQNWLKSYQLVVMMLNLLNVIFRKMPWRTVTFEKAHRFLVWTDVVARALVGWSVSLYHYDFFDTESIFTVLGCTGRAGRQGWCNIFIFTVEKRMLFFYWEGDYQSLNLLALPSISQFEWTRLSRSKAVLEASNMHCIETDDPYRGNRLWKSDMIHRSVMASLS